MIWPSDSNKVRWDLTIMALSLYNCFTVPIEVAFEPEFMNSYIIVVSNYIIDSIFLMDIIISFRVVYIDSIGNEERRLSYIAWNYIRSTSIIDILATVPWGTLLKIFPAYR